MNHIVAKRTDGKWDHICLDCKSALPPRDERINGVWICKCKNQKGMLPTVTITRKTSDHKTSTRAKRINFLPPKPKCSWLGGASGDKVKVSCGNTWRQPQECLCPTRPHKISRDGSELPILAAWGWRCNDLGDMVSSRPKVHQFCQTCPHYQPQLLLTLSESLTVIDPANHPQAPAQVPRAEKLASQDAPESPPSNPPGQ